MKTWLKQKWIQVKDAWKDGTWKPFALAAFTLVICLGILVGFFWLVWKIHPALCGFILGILVDRIATWKQLKGGSW